LAAYILANIPHLEEVAKTLSYLIYVQVAQHSSVRYLRHVPQSAARFSS